jgi:hypothetical protein
MKISNAKHTAELERMEAEIKSLYNQIIKTEQDGQACEAKISHFRDNAHCVYTELKPELWAVEFARLYAGFVTRHVPEQEDQALLETLNEFDRHEEALAEKVVRPRVKVEDDTEKSGSSFIKQNSKNEELVIELGKLREENRRLKADLHLAQSERDTLLRQCTRESKQLETKVKTIFRSTNLAQAVHASVQRKVTRGGMSMTVEQFHV